MAHPSFGRRKTETHEKSMGSYILFAWSDAMDVANLLDQVVGATKARKIYEKMDTETVTKYESDVTEQLAEFIHKTQTQRASYVAKQLKDEETKVAFLVLAILGLLRVKEVVELRDRYRMSLAPGRGNRDTAAALYLFADKVSRLYDYLWPDELFDAMGLYDGRDDDE